jgi:hypothetical protein
MKSDPRPTESEPRSEPGCDGRRLFLHEPGWKVALKIGSAREFCYMMAPGQDYYHRLLDGEIHVFGRDERLCLACAERRGLVSYEPRMLREPLLKLDFDSSQDEEGSVFQLQPRDDLEE